MDIVSDYRDPGRFNMKDYLFKLKFTTKAGDVYIFFHREWHGFDSYTYPGVARRWNIGFIVISLLPEI